MKKQAVSTSSGFNPYATNNLVVYFGHSSGKSDANISDLCTDPSISIIIIGFLRQFNGLHSPPSVDFGPHCKFQNLTSAPCPDFAASVQACQSVYQKKIFISIGGSSRGITFDGETGAKDAAEVLWNVFGAGTNVPTWRPFGTLVVDGFDIDHENGTGDHYDTFAVALRSYFGRTAETSSTRAQHFISAAPLCVNETAILPKKLYAQLDFVWVRFYNGKSCELSSTGFTQSILAWYNDLGSIQNHALYPKLYIGALSFNNTLFSSSGSGFVEASTFVQTIRWLWTQICADVIGGVMIWDGTFGLDSSNFGGMSYNAAAKFAMNSQSISC